MKRIFIGMILVCIAMFSLPLLVIPMSGLREDTPATPTAAAPPGTGDPVTEGTFSDPYKVTLLLTGTGETQTLMLEEIVAGITADELFPEFHEEAIKAQAVAVRSFLLSKIAGYLEEGIPESHQGALLCDDFSHCRSYRPIGENENSDYIARVQKAVDDTRGEYLTFNNRVAKTYFHKISSGRTENVRDVWGVEIPYLISTESPEDVRADGFRSRVFYPQDAFLTVIRGLRPSLQTPSHLSDGSPSMQCTASGLVETLTLFGESFSGKEIAESFGLRSRTFTLKFEEEQAVFDVKGNGHGVGMSQAGAGFMAKSGAEYPEILTHYYSGTSLSSLYQKP